MKNLLKEKTTAEDETGFVRADLIEVKGLLPCDLTFFFNKKKGFSYFLFHPVS